MPLRPDRLASVSGPQERVQRHIVEQVVDSVPGLPVLDALVPQGIHFGGRPHALRHDGA